MKDSYTFTQTEVATGPIKEVIENTIFQLGLHRVPLPEDIGGYEWVTRRGKYQGTLVKRLNKFIKTEMNSNAVVDLSRFGSMAGNAMTPAGTTLKLSSSFDWDAGDFGDEKSCFWKSAYIAKEVMHDYDVKAVQVFLADEGIARCWLYPIHFEDTLWPTQPQTCDGYLLFNAYGKSLRWFENFIDRLIPGATTKEIVLYAQGVMYINDERAIAVNLPPDLISVQTRMGYDTQYCDRCDEWKRDSTFYTSNWGDTYCQSCRQSELESP